MSALRTPSVSDRVGSAVALAANLLPIVGVVFLGWRQPNCSSSTGSKSWSWSLPTASPRCSPSGRSLGVVVFLALGRSSSPTRSSPTRSPPRRRRRSCSRRSRSVSRRWPRSAGSSSRPADTRCGRRLGGIRVRRGRSERIRWVVHARGPSSRVATGAVSRRAAISDGKRNADTVGRQIAGYVRGGPRVPRR